jgi:acetyl esterase/lipase
MRRLIAWSRNPWRSVLFIRWFFDRSSTATERRMRAHGEVAGVTSRLDIPCSPQDAHLTLDLFSPTDQSEPLPVVVWIHGGAWISGRKEHAGPYARLIASHGYVAASLDYTVSPESVYPTAVTQLNAALAHLVTHAADYDIDPSRIILAGDSAGAQLASQLANLATNPSFALAMDVKPALSPSQLRAVILNCGVYDVKGIPRARGVDGWGFRVALHAYFGVKEWSTTPGGKHMSTIDHVTSAFPATWISGGNADALTGTQSIPFAERLRSLGVPVTSLFFPRGHRPRTPHEYQFQLRHPDARVALDSTLEFLEAVTRVTVVG